MVDTPGTQCNCTLYMILRRREGEKKELHQSQSLGARCLLASDASLHNASFRATTCRSLPQSWQGH
eukprot:12405994-Karenia_brevis.AAC.1